MGHAILTQIISEINPRFFRFFHLREFNQQNYNQREEIEKVDDKTDRQTSIGLQYLLKLIN